MNTGVVEPHNSLTKQVKQNKKECIDDKSVYTIEANTEINNK